MALIPRYLRTHSAPDVLEDLSTVAISVAFQHCQDATLYDEWRALATQANALRALWLATRAKSQHDAATMK